MEAQSDGGDNVLFAQLSEVQEAYEFEESSGSALSQVKGSLRRHVEFWRSIGAPRYILSVICEGYRLPFQQTPAGFTFRNNRSALDHSEFVNEAILELLHSGRVMELNSPPDVVNPLSVSIQPNGKKRLILDLRYINNYLIKRRVKCEDCKIALSYFQKGSFMTTVDLKSGYHHIEIHPDHLRFLGFAWKFPGEASIRYFVFTVHPFALSSAPYISTKCLKPLEKYWRFNGVNTALFLDDGWLIHSDRDTYAVLATNIWSDLRKSGFITNDEKSQCCPSQVLEWLGIIWNTINGTITIFERRESSIAKSVDKILLSDHLVSAWELASLVGRIISGGAVFGNISRLMTRYCSISVASALEWDSKFYLDQYCVRERYFWESNLKRLNRRVVADSPYRMSNYVIYSDASATGCGAHLDINGEQVCNKQWDLEERRKSPTWRELSTILFTLHSFLPLLIGSSVKWFSDSVCKIIQVGSMRSNLHAIALEIFQFCANNGIELEVHWIPRTEIERADYISRISDLDDWQISADCFMSLEESWGFIQWIVLLVIIIRRLASFFLDFGTQVVAGWIFSCKVWKAKIALLSLL